MTRFSLSSTFPIVTGQSDHDAPFLTINNIATESNLIHYNSIGKIKSYWFTKEIKISCKCEKESVYVSRDVII
jgi:hypothetical protein